MIARDITVSLCILSLLKYDRIFGKNLEHDTLRGNIKSLTQQFAGSVLGLAREIYVSFLFLWLI